MTDSTCAIPECDNPKLSRGWCNKHYLRWRTHGDPLGGHARYQTPEQSFEARIKPEGDCLVWAGHILPDGYAKIRVGSKKLQVHRYAWIRVNGPIPEGMFVDHICHNRACVKVEHLRLTTNKQNMENRKGAASTNALGIRGVRRDGEKYRARVRHDGKLHDLGLFATAEEASEAARLKRLELFTHNNLDRKATR